MTTPVCDKLDVKDAKKTLNDCFVVFVGLPALVCLKAFTLVLLWKWFLSPVSTIVPEINFYQALGILATIGFFRSFSESKRNSNSHIVLHLVSTGMYLLVGWLVHLAIAQNLWMPF